MTDQNTKTPTKTKNPIKTALFDEQLFRQCIPAAMLQEKRWVRYFLKDKPEGGTAKIPLGNHSDPNTWDTFDNCVKQIENDQQGIGYNFLNGEIQPLDIDHCRNPKTGQICKEAMVLLERIPSWAEYSVSGQGIHVLFKGNVRGKQLTETCVQYWNPKNSPRFLALTCDMVGDAFKKLVDVGEDFNYIFATARHISAKIREELRTIDYEQWASLPDERAQPDEVTKEKPKTKTRKLHKDFDLVDFLKFYDLPVDNIAKNDIGTCYRITTCPIKGESHVGQNSTTTNFILSNDGGLAFHCQSTGCVEWSVAQVIEHLAERKTYPKPIYEKKQPQSASRRSSRLECVADIRIKPEVWLWPGYLSMNQLTHFAGASSEGKSPVTLDLCRPVTTGGIWPDGQPNKVGPRSVIIMASEDDWADTIAPRLKLAGADISKVHKFISTIDGDEGDVVDVSTNLEHDLDELKKQIRSLPDVGLIIIDPITNYLGSKAMNKEEDIRKLLMPISEQIAQSMNVSVITVGHINKGNRDVSPKQRVMGASAFVGVARQLIMFGADPDETGKKYRHIMGEERNQSAPVLKYKTEKVSVDWPGWKGEKVLRVVWCGISTAHIEDAINPDKEEMKDAIELAVPALKMILPPGTKLNAEQCKNSVLGGAYKDKADNFWLRVRKRAGVVTKQEGRQWWWCVEDIQSSIEQFDGAKPTIGSQEAAI